MGYGTFITRNHWRNKSNVKVCKVRNFRRILPKGNWFPYVLSQEGSSFWALKFDVSDNQLQRLDNYEGISEGLYRRVEIKVLLLDQSEEKAFIYVPTKTTIQKYGLSLEMDVNDNWIDEIKKHPDVVEKFPKLVERL